MYYDIIVWIIALVCLSLGIYVGISSGYEKGQIDALNGVVNYQLVTNENQTVIWTKIEVEEVRD